MPSTADLDPDRIARELIAARREARILDAFPGPVPPDLESAYRVQEAVLNLQTLAVVGWKVAAIRPEFRDRYAAERLAGPVLAGTLTEAGDGEVVEAPVFAGGFAALEAEFAFRMGRDLPPRDKPYEAGEVADAVASMHIAAEIAGSPLPVLNDLGPGAVIADHGNNAGLVVGPTVPDWRGRAPESLKTEMVIDDRVEGTGSAASIPGGPVTALLFLANHLSSRGRTLAAGDIVSCGATTGVHKVGVGVTARLSFGDCGAFTLKTVAIRR